MTSTTLDTRETQAQWFASWFDSPHYHRLYGYRDDAEAARFVDSLIARLRPAPDAEALDLGCGAGRHARQLAAQGLRVTGLDLAAGSIAHARRFARPGLRFARHDMREPFGAETFDYVFNFFTSFGYFDDPTEHRQVVSNIAASLRCGGTLVMDYLNVAAADARQTPAETKTIDGVTFRLTRWSDARRFYKRIEIAESPASPPLVYVEKVAKFGIEDFRALFAAAGLTIEDAYGDYRLAPYRAAASPRLVLVARKACASREVLADAA